MSFTHSVNDNYIQHEYKMSNKIWTLFITKIKALFIESFNVDIRFNCGWFA